jgi:hypothetical protein
MDETKSTPAPASTSSIRLAGLLWSATRGRVPILAIFMLGANAIWILPSILSLVRGEPVGLSAGDIVFLLAFTLALGVLWFVLSVGLSVSPDWFGFYEWARRRRSEQIWEKIAALGDAHKAPFRFEQRCKVSPTEEVWVRHVKMPRSDKVLLEVLHTRNGGETWERLHLRLSPWARFKCIMLEGEWPPAPPRTRHLSCDKDGISFEVIGYVDDSWEGNQINVWRATYRPRWKWWTLKLIGRLSPGTPTLWETLSQGQGRPVDPLRPTNA